MLKLPHSFPLRPARRAFLLLTGVGLLFTAAGCASHPPRDHHPEPAQPPLIAHADYFGGAVGVDARVTGFRYVIAGEDGGRPGHGGSGGPPPGGGPHGGGGMGGPPGGGGMGGPPGGGESGGGDGEHSQGHTGGAMMGAMPRQVLRLKFTNHASTPVTIAVTELNSALGNFVPQPARLTIEPGATAALDPVSGDAGGVLSWLDVTLAIRREGANESQVLHLVPSGEPAEANPPPPPPGKN